VPANRNGSFIFKKFLLIKISIMKKTTIISLLSAIATFILYSNLNAQRLTTGSMTSDVVTVNNSSATVNNLFMMDSIDAGYQAGETRSFGNEVMHLASFEIELGSTDAINILKTLFSGIQGQQLQALTLHKLSSQRQVIEERSFGFVTVKEILFPELNAESMETAKAKVIIQARDVFNDSKSGHRIVTDPGRSKMAASNRFRLIMGDLPAQRVLRISNLRIVPSFKAEHLYFSLDVPSEDANRWKDWFNTGAGRGVSKDAFISLLDETASQDIFSLQLSEVEIVSVSVLSNPRSIPKTTIGLRTRNIPIIQ
jgi:hypothetical protein